jgi:hypothetical protein
MPFTVLKRGGKYVAAKKDGSRIFGTHETEAEAWAQIAAIKHSMKERGERK